MAQIKKLADYTESEQAATREKRKKELNLQDLDFNDEEAVKAYIDTELKTRFILAALRDFVAGSVAAMWHGLMNVPADEIAKEFKKYYGVEIPLEAIERELSGLRGSAPTMMRGILNGSN